MDKQTMLEFYLQVVQNTRDELNQARIRRERAEQQITSARLELERAKRELYNLGWTG